MEIEEFIKHLESKGYVIISQDDDLVMQNKETKRIISYLIMDKHLAIIDEQIDKYTYFGKIESLEQFDLIDRLTS